MLESNYPYDTSTEYIYIRCILLPGQDLSIKSLKLENQVLELSKVGCAVSSDGIPTSSSIPSGARNNSRSLGLRLASLGVVAIASNSITASDISQNLGSMLVDKRVQPSQAWLASSETSIVQQTNDGSPNRSSSTGASTTSLLTSVDNLIVRRDAVASDIRETSTFPVSVGTVVLLSLLGDSLHVCLDSLVLVAGTGEVLAETSRGAFPGDLGGNIDSTADGGEVRAGSREDGVKLDSLVIGSETSRTNTNVTR